MFGLTNFEAEFVQLDPRFGSFKLEMHKMIGSEVNLKPVPFEQISASTGGDVMQKLAKIYGSSEKLKGLYLISDPSMLELSGTTNDRDRSSINLQFMLCRKSEDPGCATEDEIRAYLSDKLLTLWALSNFINMEEVLPVDDTLQQWPNLLSYEKIDLDKPIAKFLELEEYRTEL